MPANDTSPPPAHLDWSAYETQNDFGFGMGDPFGAPPAEPGSGFKMAIGTCTGKLDCHRLDAEVMCPSYRATGDERHATYHRAQMLKAAVEGELGEDGFASDTVQEAMALCVGCKGCKRECPNGVDMALLGVEAKARRWARLGHTPRRERLFAHLPRLIPLLQRWRALLGLRERFRALAWLGERLLGISARRALPLPSARSFLSSQSAEVVGDGSAGEVVLLADTFSNHFEPEIAHAALAVLTAAGYRVHLARGLRDERPLCCGRSFLSNGLVDAAREEATRLLNALRPYAERELPIIGLEPSCLLMLRDEYHALGLGEAVRPVARHAVLFEEFIAREHAAGRFAVRLRPMPGARALVHGHCHQKAFGLMPAMESVLALVPGLTVDVVESSCCGMGGGFGYEAEHYDLSMAMGEQRLLPAMRNAPEDALLVANGTSCRHQIAAGAHRQARHIALILHWALEPASA